MSSAPAVAAPAPPTSLVSLVSTTEQCTLRPRAFVLLWSGVLALAFEGWPAPLASLKAQLNEQAANLGLPLRENLGSVWPKISLGCLQDGRSLTQEQLLSLMELIRSFDQRVATSEWRHHIQVLSGVVSIKRNLEQQLFRQDMPLVAPASGFASEEPVAASAARVSQMFAEYETAPQRMEDVNEAGRRRSFYAEETEHVPSLVALVAAQPKNEAELPSFIVDFQRRVNELLPEHFYFPQHSLHTTVRAL